MSALIRRRHLLAALFFVFISSQFAQDDPLAGLPASQTWLDHLNAGLMPFWTHSDALGTPMGAFPASRCDDGKAVDFKRPCEEVRRNSWLLTQQRTLVAVSRQTYGYGVAFHMTGDPQYLQYMKAGVDYLRGNLIDRKNGGMFTTQDVATNQWGPKMEFRNPQELGYGLLGLAFYYYLTRDPAVLADILPIRDHILGRYYLENPTGLGWVLERNGTDLPTQRRLVAQLDQMNAYMVLLTPILPEPYRTEWKQNLSFLSHVLIDQFYSPGENLFFLNANSPADLDLKMSGTDFGHTIKAMWMIRWAGMITGEDELVRFSEENGPKVLQRAFLEDTGSWAQDLQPGGAINPDKSWWIYAELDQFAATMSLKERALARYLPRTYDYWLRYFVDPLTGEVWNGVNGKTNQPIRDLPKAWPWKNAYHSLEHALVAYITTRQLEGNPVTLYYAFPEGTSRDLLRPYFYDGVLTNLDRRPGGVVAVTYREIH